MKHFKPSEFVLDQDPSKPAFEKMSPHLVDLLEKARGFSSEPFIITSSLRSFEHNEKVGGAANSSHLSGHAVDIKCSGTYQRSIILPALIRAGFRRVGIYSGHIHVDTDPFKSPAIWLG